MRKYAYIAILLLLATTVAKTNEETEAQQLCVKVSKKEEARNKDVREKLVAMCKHNEMSPDHWRCMDASTSKDESFLYASKQCEHVK